LSAFVQNKQLIVAIRIQINDCIRSPDFLPSDGDGSERFRSGKVVGNQGDDADKDGDGKCFSHQHHPLMAVKAASNRNLLPIALH
jgi:hypothetical protein